MHSFTDISCLVIGFDREDELASVNFNKFSFSRGNEGSRRTILNNGGVYESTVHEPERDIWLERYWIDLSGRD